VVQRAQCQLAARAWGGTIPACVAVAAGRDQCGIHHTGELAKCPASCLGVVRVEVCEKGVIGQVPEVGAVVHHGVSQAWDVIVCGYVVVVAAVQGVELQEVSGHF